MKSRATAYYGKKNRIAKRSSHTTLFLVIGIVSLLAAMTWAAVQATALRIIVIGDSTASTYDATNPLKGWGQELGYFFSKNVTVLNKAIGGRSSRSFIEDGHWTSTLAILQKGDYLLVSFGTNDAGSVAARHTDTAGFRTYFTQYVTESRAKGVIPILVSTVNQNTWTGTTFREGFTDYRTAMLRVVTALNVPFIDLEKKTATLFQSLGQTYCSNLIFSPGQATHFQEMGAINVAKLIAQGIGELSTDTTVVPLAAELAPQYMITIKSNKTGAGLVTASGTYPQGAPITLEVIPNSGETFQNWQDASGKSVSTQTSYQFTMGAAPTSYGAIFKGGTTNVSHEKTLSAVHSLPSISISGNVIISIMSSDKIISARVTDLLGKDILRCEPNGAHATLDASSFTHGIYFVSARTGAGSATQLIRR
jgi:lysophospholipase L1-like esterase